jgi:hypothetical protein
VGHPVAGEFAAPPGGALRVVAEDADFFAQGPDLGDAVEADELPPFSGGEIADLFQAL